MDNVLGLLKVCIKRGINLAVRDVRSSDPYVIVQMGKQTLRTRVVKKDVDPQWNEKLTLSVLDSNLPVFLTVYDHDTFSRDDKMGDAEITIGAIVEAAKLKLDGVPNNTIISKTQPSRSNYLSQETHVVWKDGKLLQNMFLRLKNVECGEVEIELQWVYVHDSRVF